MTEHQYDHGRACKVCGSGYDAVLDNVAPKECPGRRLAAYESFDEIRAHRDRIMRDEGRVPAPVGLDLGTLRPGDTVYCHEDGSFEINRGEAATAATADATAPCIRREHRSLSMLEIPTY